MADSVIIELENDVLNQSKLVKNLTTISTAMEWFLTNIIAATKAAGVIPENTTPGETSVSKVITRKQFQNFAQDNKLDKKTGGVSISLISVRLRELIDHKVCTVQVYSSNVGRGKYHHFTISDLSPLAALPSIRNKTEKASRRTKNQVLLQHELFLKDEQAIYLNGKKDLNFHIHQQIFNGILDSAMRLSHKDDRKEIQITYQIMGEPLLITSTCSSAEGSGIAMLTDQRAMRPIMAFCKREISQRKTKLIAEYGDKFLPSMVPNLFRLDIHDLCRLMDLQPSSDNIDNAVAMMQRLTDTSFKVDARSNQWFKNNFTTMPGNDGTKSDTFEFRFLQNLEIAHEHSVVADLFNAKSEQLKPRFYTFSLEIRLFYSLVIDDSPTLFLSHKDLSFEYSGIIQRLYNWARFWVSGSDRPGVSQKWYSLLDMHVKLTPAVRLDNFRRHFLRALEKKAVGAFKVGQGGKALIYGYYVHYESRDDGEFFRFERDRNDPIVGDNSQHNVMKRQSLLEHLLE